jgi:predicted amidohydrolase YtcJ
MDTSTVPQEYGIAFFWGYDDSQLEEKRHPTRDDLDAVSTRIPVYAIDQSISASRTARHWNFWASRRPCPTLPAT